MRRRPLDRIIFCRILWDRKKFDFGGTSVSYRHITVAWFQKGARTCLAAAPWVRFRYVTHSGSRKRVFVAASAWALSQSLDIFLDFERAPNAP